MNPRTAEHDSTREKTTPDDQWTVFLVDDDPDDLALGERVLKESPHIGEIVCVSDSEDLFRQLHERQFSDQPSNNLIILDIHMPGLNGIELLAQLRSSPYTVKVPVMILTGDSRTDNIEKTYGMDANGFITKPLSSGHLSHIHGVLQRGSDWKANWS